MRDSHQCDMAAKERHAVWSTGQGVYQTSWGSMFCRAAAPQKSVWSSYTTFVEVPGEGDDQRLSAEVDEVPVLADGATTGMLVQCRASFRSFWIYLAKAAEAPAAFKPSAIQSEVAAAGIPLTSANVADLTLRVASGPPTVEAAATAASFSTTETVKAIQGWSLRKRRKVAVATVIKEMLPPPEIAYSSLAAAKAALKDWASAHGYGLSVSNSSRKSQAADLRCWMGGPTPEEKRRNVELDGRGNKRRGSTRMTACLFTVAVRRKVTGAGDAEFRVQVTNSVHEGHGYSEQTWAKAANSVTQDEAGEATALFQIPDVKPMKVLTVLNKVREQKGQVRLSSTKALYNLRGRNTARANAERATLQDALLAINAVQDDAHLSVQTWSDPDSGELNGIFLVHNAMADKVSHFKSVVIVDTTYCVNKHAYPFVQILGTLPWGSHVPVACAVIESENAETFGWVLQCLKQFMGGAPDIIVSDNDKAFRKARVLVFPDTVHLLCIWHAACNVSAKGSSLLTTTVEQDAFLNGFKAMIHAETSQECDNVWRKMRETFQGFRGGPEALEYVQNNWLVPDNWRRVARHHTKVHRHQGQRTTSFVEGSHASLKSVMPEIVSRKKLTIAGMVDQVTDWWTRRIDEAELGLLKERTIKPLWARHANDLLQDVIGHVCLKALEDALEEAHEVVDINADKKARLREECQRMHCTREFFSDTAGTTTTQVVDSHQLQERDTTNGTDTTTQVVLRSTDTTTQVVSRSTDTTTQVVCVDSDDAVDGPGCYKASDEGSNADDIAEEEDEEYEICEMWSTKGIPCRHRMLFAFQLREVPRLICDDFDPHHLLPNTYKGSPLAWTAEKNDKGQMIDDVLAKCVSRMRAVIGNQVPDNATDLIAATARYWSLGGSRIDQHVVRTPEKKHESKRGRKAHTKQKRMGTSQENFEKAQDAQRKLEVQRCSLCKQTGHNRAGCRESPSKAAKMKDIFIKAQKQERAAAKAALREVRTQRNSSNNIDTSDDGNSLFSDCVASPPRLSADSDSSVDRLLLSSPRPERQGRKRSLTPTDDATEISLANASCRLLFNAPQGGNKAQVPRPISPKSRRTHFVMPGQRPTTTAPPVPSTVSAHTARPKPRPSTGGPQDPGEEKFWNSSGRVGQANSGDMSRFVSVFGEIPQSQPEATAKAFALCTRSTKMVTSPNGHCGYEAIGMQCIPPMSAMEVRQGMVEWVRQQEAQGFVHPAFDTAKSDGLKKRLLPGGRTPSPKKRDLLSASISVDFWLVSTDLWAFAQWLQRPICLFTSGSLREWATYLPIQRVPADAGDDWPRPIGLVFDLNHFDAIEVAKEGPLPPIEPFSEFLRGKDVQEWLSTETHQSLHRAFTFLRFSEMGCTDSDPDANACSCMPQPLRETLRHVSHKTID